MQKVAEYRGFTIYLNRNGEYYTPALGLVGARTHKTLAAAKKAVNRYIGADDRRLDNSATS